MHAAVVVSVIVAVASSVAVWFMVASFSGMSERYRECPCGLLNARMVRVTSPSHLIQDVRGAKEGTLLWSLTCPSRLSETMPPPWLALSCCDPGVVKRPNGL